MVPMVIGHVAEEGWMFVMGGFPVPYYLSIMTSQPLFTLTLLTRHL